MAHRVIRTSKDPDGDITGLCGTTWKVSKEQAIRDIRNDRHHYDVSPGIYVRVATRGASQYLTTDADSTSTNNLNNLDNC